MSPEIAALIAKRLAAPKNFSVVTTFANGATRAFETETMGQAQNYAIGEKRKIGKALISRETGQSVCVISVEIKPL